MSQTRMLASDYAFLSLPTPYTFAGTAVRYSCEYEHALEDRLFSFVVTFVVT